MSEKALELEKGDDRRNGGGVQEPPPAPLVDTEEVRKWSFYRAIIAEFMATLLLLYISLTTLVGTGAGSAGLITTAWAFGGIIFVLVYCIVGVSGGHINPAVTFGLFIAKRVTLTKTLAFMVAQCAGAMCGALIARGVQGSDEFHSFGQHTVNFVRPGHTTGQALGAEIMGTFVLLYTVLCATDPIRNEIQNARDAHVPALASLPIGFAVFVIHLATIPITGTSINPARSLGAAVANPHHGKWSQHDPLSAQVVLLPTTCMCRKLQHSYSKVCARVKVKRISFYEMPQT